MPIRVQRYIALLSVVLFFGKIAAWQLTHSVTILTDALESIVNIIAGFIGLYSIVLAARPRDNNHPYGHGKAEFLSSAVEGTLIIIAGLVIIYEAAKQLLVPHKLERLDAGLIIIAIAGAINFAAGKYAEKQGIKSNSPVLISAGKHLQTDAYSTAGIIVGLLLLLLTHGRWLWLDGAVALCFAFIIIITGYKVLRRSIAGIMDETDLPLLTQVIKVLQDNRLPPWIDLHNMRVIQYGSMMHVDAHMTLPYYFTVAEADVEIHKLEALISTEFNNSVELFIHIDGCMPYQCKLCAMPDCPVRQEPPKELLVWTTESVWADAKHGKTTA
ncbi:MAG: cation diffusion facilitator family transporter [Bacteroidota bacterium]